MKTVRVNKAFPYSPNGIEVVDYDTGDHQLPDEVADLAIAEGWAVKLDEEPTTVAPEGAGPAAAAGDTDAPDMHEARAVLNDSVNPTPSDNAETAPAAGTNPEGEAPEAAAVDMPKTGELGL